MTHAATMVDTESNSQLSCSEATTEKTPAQLAAKLSQNIDEGNEEAVSAVFAGVCQLMACLQEARYFSSLPVEEGGTKVQQTLHSVARLLARGDTETVAISTWGHMVSSAENASSPADDACESALPKECAQNICQDTKPDALAECARQFIHDNELSEVSFRRHQRTMRGWLVAINDLQGKGKFVDAAEDLTCLAILYCLQKIKAKLTEALNLVRSLLRAGGHSSNDFADLDCTTESTNLLKRYGTYASRVLIVIGVIEGLRGPIRSASAAEKGVQTVDCIVPQLRKMLKRLHGVVDGEPGLRKSERQQHRARLQESLGGYETSSNVKRERLRVLDDACAIVPDALKAAWVAYKKNVIFEQLVHKKYVVATTAEEGGRTVDIPSALVVIEMLVPESHWLYRPRGALENLKSLITFGKLKTYRPGPTSNLKPHCVASIAAETAPTKRPLKRAALYFGLSEPCCIPCAAILSAVYSGLGKEAYTPQSGRIGGGGACLPSNLPNKVKRQATKNLMQTLLQGLETVTIWHDAMRGSEAARRAERAARFAAVEMPERPAHLPKRFLATVVRKESDAAPDVLEFEDEFTDEETPDRPPTPAGLRGAREKPQEARLSKSFRSTIKEEQPVGSDNAAADVERCEDKDSCAGEEGTPPRSEDPDDNEEWRGDEIPDLPPILFRSVYSPRYDLVGER